MLAVWDDAATSDVTMLANVKVRVRSAFNFNIAQSKRASDPDTHLQHTCNDAAEHTMQIIQHFSIKIIVINNKHTIMQRSHELDAND